MSSNPVTESGTPTGVPVAFGNGVIYQGHVLDVLKTLPDESVQCCITSPPYWGLRDYKLEPQVWDAIDGRKTQPEVDRDRVEPRILRDGEKPNPGEVLERGRKTGELVARCLPMVMPSGDRGGKRGR